MPHKPKRRPPPPSDTYQQVNLQNAETYMSQFIKYYKGIGLVSDEEWKHLMESLFTNLPVTYRICERSRHMNNQYDGKAGTLTEAEVLRDFLKNTVLPKLSEVMIDDTPFEMKPLPWYRKEMAWKMNVDTKVFEDHTDLQPIRAFAQEEERLFNIFEQEITSIIPALLVDIQPNHKVLELRAQSGHTTAQILEQILVNPKRTPDGLVVANEKDSGKMQYRWNRGTNVMFTHTEPETYPDLYTTEEHHQGSKLFFDRVFIDAPTSSDGSMRSNHKIRTGWNVTTAQKNHKNLKAVLRRGLELLELNGQLVYVTNSMNPIENEAVVAALIDEAPDILELVDVRSRVPDFHTRPGMTSWKVMSQGLVFYEKFDASPAWFQKENEATLFPPEKVAMYNLERCVRVMPHDNDTGAMFVAVFTKFAQLPWVKDEDAEEEMETAEGDKEKKAEGDSKECPYIGPIRCDINVCVTDIEWTTEVTDEALNTRVDVENNTFELAPMQIARHCIPPWLQKKMREQSAVYTDLSPTSGDWEHLKTLLDIKKFDPVSNCLQFSQDGRHQICYYCSPLLKQVIKYNPEIVQKSRGFAGGLPILKGTSSSKPEVMSVMPVLPYATARVMEVPRIDMVTLCQEKEVIFSKLTDKTETALEAMTQGLVIFMYTPKGKNADPKCPFYLQREKFPSFVKHVGGSRLMRNHYLRVCGVDPTEEADEEVKEESMDVE